jgi:cytoskeletal protein CcmA (bactofilin family)
MLARTPAPSDSHLTSTGAKPGNPVTLLTVVGQTARIEGKFDIADSLQIECEIGGELAVGGQLVVGEKGVVRANVRTVDAVIHGVYEGNMVASGNIEITSTGRVVGNIETDSFVINKGGFFNGNVTRQTVARTPQHSAGPIEEYPVVATA